MRVFFTAVAVLASTAAFAQQQPQTAIDRVSVAFGQCVGSAQQQLDQIADLQKRLAEAQAKIKELEGRPAQ